MTMMMMAASLIWARLGHAVIDVYAVRADTFVEIKVNFSATIKIVCARLRHGVYTVQTQTAITLIDVDDFLYAAHIKIK